MKKRCLQYNGFVFGSQIKKREGHLFFADFFVIFRSDFFVLMKSIFLFASFLFLLPSASAVNEMCSSDTECGVGEYCELTSCKSETGFCQGKPDFCMDIYDPVCGCDGATYTNECHRSSFGISRDYKGECISDCKTNSDCDSGYFCEKNGCAVDNGSCVQRVDACDDEYDPVCGCDGMTYGNDCTRKSAGVSRAFEGECPTSCQTNADCVSEEYCKKDSCNESAGTCTIKPDVCPKLFSPVCGCDGSTYSSECYANMSGENMAFDEACEESSQQEEISFTDITAHPYENAIRYVAEKGIVNGYDDGTYRPNVGIDRAQLTKIVMLSVYNNIPQEENCFPDISAEWFAPYVCYAKEENIINGYADGLFRPANPVTYAEALKIVLNSINANISSDENTEWFWGYIGYAFENKLSLSTIRKPHEPITRGEMAEIIYWSKDLET
jgi:hypothetical protein